MKVVIYVRIFLKFIHYQFRFTGKDLYNGAISSLGSFNLDIQNCRGQGYDGAGTVAGKVSGFAALLLKENPEALYTHCASHRLNLAICSSCDIVGVRNPLSTVKDVVYFFKYLPIGTEHLEKFILSKEEGKKVKTKLLDTSRTRREARIDGLHLFEDEFVSAMKTLEFFCLNPESKVNRDTVPRSQALLNHLSNFLVSVTLEVTRKISDFTHSVTDLLQAKLNHIVVGFDLTASLIDVISNARVNVDFLFGE